MSTITPPENKKWDAVVLGGGLAGLTFGLHLRKRVPTAKILIIERASFPLPEAAHKVGESTVEIGAHYFADVLGLREHMQNDQLPKLGLRFFFTQGNNTDITKRMELGSNRFFPSGSFQIDRGRFENYLFSCCAEQGITVWSESRVRDVEISEDENTPHRAKISRPDGDIEVSGRWLVDASGIGSVLKKKMDLEIPCEHNRSAAWFRYSTKINIDDWGVNSPEWTRDHQGQYSRWFSTNHLMGRGYWVWVIPLASGSTSVGIVTDSKIHPLSEYNTLEKAYAWLRKYEPQCAEKLEGLEPLVQDFLARKNYAHRCKKVFSEKRWGMTGDAGVFIDPFYSPGSDFIALANTFLTDLIEKDLTGTAPEQYARIYNELYLGFAENTFSLYEQQYAVHANATIMSSKVVWDYAVYWGFLAFVFYQKRLTNLSLFIRIRNDLARVSQMNYEMQKFFREWNERETCTRQDEFLDLRGIKPLFNLNAQLREPLSDDEFVLRLSENIAYMAALKEELIAFAEPMEAPPPPLTYFGVTPSPAA